YIMARWDRQFGDRINELVIIGQDMSEAQIRKELDNCLCSESELSEFNLLKVRGSVDTVMHEDL
ncbi:MAG: GTP-binding protein, partial [Bacteroidales bacterium]|nr:GTP-binding protein [Bacteroidales bacterium]